MDKCKVIAITNQKGGLTLHLSIGYYLRFFSL